MTNEYQARINACTSLTDLCKELNAIESELAAANADDAFDEPLGGYVDLADLPTFGGKTPANTLGIWSWDESEMIVAEGNKWEVVARDETN